MNYRELVAHVENLPDVGESFRPYLIQRSRVGQPTTAFITLIPLADGTYTAFSGDFRDKTEPVINSEGESQVFPDEDAACEWAWNRIRAARGPAPVYTPEQLERARVSSDDQYRRYEELRRAADSGQRDVT